MFDETKATGEAPATTETNPLTTVTLDRDELNRALSLLDTHIVPRKSSRPSMGAVWLVPFRPGCIALVGTNNELWARIELEGQTEGITPIALNASALRRFVQKQKTATVEIKQAGDDERAFASAGRTRVAMQSVDLAKLPAYPNISERDCGRMPETFRDDIARLYPFVRSKNTGGQSSCYFTPALGDCDAAGMVASDSWIVSGVQWPEMTSRDFDAFTIEKRDLKALKAAINIVKLTKTEPVQFSQATTAPNYGECVRNYATWRAGAVTLIMQTGGGAEGIMERMRELCGAETWPLALPEMEPNFNSEIASRLRKAFPSTLSFINTGGCVIVADDDEPRWCALVMLHEAAGQADSKFEARDDMARRHAKEALCNLAVAAGHRLDGERTALVTDNDNQLRGLTIGKVSEYGEPMYVERQCYETFTTERVDVGRTPDQYDNGSFSFVAPTSMREPLCDISVTIDGDVTALRTNEAGALELSKEAIGELCGPVDEMERVDIEPMQFWHGERVPAGWFIPAAGSPPPVTCSPAERQAYCESCYPRPVAHDDERTWAERHDGTRIVPVEAENKPEPIAKAIEDTPCEPETPVCDLEQVDNSNDLKAEIAQLKSFIGGLSERIELLEGSQPVAAAQKPQAARERIASRYIAMRAKIAALNDDLSGWIEQEDRRDDTALEAELAQTKAALERQTHKANAAAAECAVKKARVLELEKQLSDKSMTIERLRHQGDGMSNLMVKEGRCHARMRKAAIRYRSLATASRTEAAAQRARGDALKAALTADGGEELSGTISDEPASGTPSTIIMPVVNSQPRERCEA